MNLTWLTKADIVLGMVLPEVHRSVSLTIRSTFVTVSDFTEQP
jgi:hypothetical protein